MGHNGRLRGPNSMNFRKTSEGRGVILVWFPNPLAFESESEGEPCREQYEAKITNRNKCQLQHVAHNF